jgi:hypothetical protein
MAGAKPEPSLSQPAFAVGCTLRARSPIGARPPGPRSQYPGGRPGIPGGVWPWDANRDADIRPSLANVLNRLGYFQHIASMLRRLMLDHAVDDHPLDALDLMRHRNLEVVR